MRTSYNVPITTLLCWGLCIALLSVGIKLTLTNGALLPGLDGAYYWVQVRSLLRTGTLAYPDLPLVFWVQAGIARLVGDIPLAVRLSDALIPMLSVIPVILLYRSSHTTQSWYTLPLLLGVVLLHPIQLYYFTGDFIKNEATVPLVFVLGWLLIQYHTDARWQTLAGICVTLGVIAFCHFGILLLSVCMTTCWVVAHMVLRGTTGSWVWRLISIVCVATIVMGLLFWLSPDKLNRLVRVLSNVSLVTANPIGLLMIFGVPEVLRPDILFATISGQIGAVVLGWCTWQHKTTLSTSTKVTVYSFLVTTWIFSSPFISVEWALRFTALSYVPLCLAVIVLWPSTTARTTHICISLLICSVLCVSTIMYPHGTTPPVLTASEWRDFRTLTAAVTLERPSIVVARHGLDFLTAWYLNTHVAGEDMVIADTDNTYNAHYILKKRQANATSTSGESDGVIIYENTSFTLTRTK